MSSSIPDQRSAVRLPTPALPGCTPMQVDRRSIRSVFWYSETDVLPSHLSLFLPGRALVAAAPDDGARLLTSSRGEDGEPLMAADETPHHRLNQQDSIPDEGGVPVDGQRDDLGAESGGAPTLDAEETFSQDSFETANSQGYRTEEDEAQDIPISMVHLGWLNVELKSDDWVKVMDQPPVRIMKIAMDEEKDRKKTKNFVYEDDGKDLLCHRLGNEQTARTG